MRLKFIEPLMPTLVDKPPEGDGWSHEVKFDGYAELPSRPARTNSDGRLA
ncbi:hypothetical protein [Mesorhizobium temperatum]